MDLSWNSAVPIHCSNSDSGLGAAPSIAIASRAKLNSLDPGAIASSRGQTQSRYPQLDQMDQVELKLQLVAKEAECEE
jgi:hypothetical protein